MSKAHMYTALIALAAYAAVSMLQSSWPIPVIGKHLPGGK